MPLVVYEDMVQGTPQWHALRDGLYTGSNAHKLLKFGAIEYSQTTATNFKGNFHTKRGHLLEDQAIELFERIKNCTVMRPAFITNTSYPQCGYSPDAMLVEAVVECKAFNEQKHMAMWHGDIPMEILAQVHFGMLITERSLTYLLIYNPDLPAKYALKIIIIKANPAILANMRRILKTAKVQV
jgi:hypothetical protein